MRLVLLRRRPRLGECTISRSLARRRDLILRVRLVLLWLELRVGGRPRRAWRTRWSRHRGARTRGFGFGGGANPLRLPGFLMPLPHRPIGVGGRAVPQRVLPPRG